MKLQKDKHNMLIKLEFNTEISEDLEDWAIYSDAKKNYCIIEEFEQWLRYNFKHREMTDIQNELYEEIANKFYEVKSSYYER